MLNTVQKQLIFSFSVIALYVSHFIILGEDTFILIHDNLDSNLVWFKTLADEGAFFASNDTPISIFANMPRYAMSVNELSVISFLFAVLPAFWAYAINSILIHFIAFAGMFLLLKHHLCRQEQDKQEQDKQRLGEPLYIVIAVALCFALLPFWPSGGLSVAGMPLALYAFLNIKNYRGAVSDWIIIGFIPFYSSLILSFFAFIGLLGLIFIYDVVKRRKINWAFVAATSFLTGLFLLTEYRQIINLFDPLFISHRSEFVGVENNFIQSLKQSIGVFLKGQYHAASLHSYLALPVILIGGMIAFFTKSSRRILVFIGGGIGITSLIYGFWNFAVVGQLKEEFEILRLINFSRFHFLQPLLWFLGFYIALIQLWKFNRFYSRVIIIIALSGQIFLSFANSLFIQEYKKSGITYEEFYAQESLEDIKQYVQDDQARFILIGLHPAIAQYNGIKTADFYLANYPLAYKKEFKEGLGGQIEADETLRLYFDNWGSRAYYFTPQTKTDFIGVKHNDEIPVFLGSKEELKDVDAEYIISRVPINQGVVFMKQFEHEDSAWTLYLYKIE